MASVNAPRGLVLARKNGSGSNSTGISTINVNGSPIKASALLPSNIYTGDIVRCNPAGTIIPCTASATKVVNGVFQGCSYVSSTGAQKYSRYWTGGATATDVKIFISDDPKQTYFVQANATCTAAGNWAGNSSMNTSITLGTGSTKTGNSATLITAAAVTAGQNIVRIIRRAPWDTGTGTSAGATDAYPWWEVRLNTHVDNFVTTTASTG